MQVILGETERLTQMVEELLDFSAVQSGRFQLDKTKIDVIAELSDAVLMFRTDQRENMTLLYDEPDTSLWSRAIAIVCGRYSSMSSTMPSSIPTPETPSPSRGAATGKLVIAVADTGCGINAEDLPKVKYKFFKANSTRRGSGIGLAVADEIVSLHGGTLELDSEESVGTTVTITIPTVDSL